MQKNKLKIAQKSTVLAGLNEEQVKAVTHGEGPLLIVAGAGTGKTTVIMRRIAHLIENGVKPEEILALAFGDKAAAEMEERADRLLPLGYYDLQISTFHAFGELVLREHGLEIGLPEFKVLDEVGQWLLMRNNFEKFDLDYYRPLGNPTRFIKAFIRHFAKAKDELITPEEYLAHVEKLKMSLDQSEAGLETRDLEIKRVTEVAQAYHLYQRALLQNNAVDFGDLVNYTLRLFRERPRVLQHYRERFKYILIDEFQDTNYAQYELVRLLAAPRNNLTAVGDDDQSIFKFRGASISNILHFQKDYPQAKFISLVRNYRSGQKILDAAHAFIAQNDPDRLEVRLSLDKKLLNPDDPEGEIQSLEASDFVAEARLVLEKILQKKDANPEFTWDDFAILGRSHDSLDPFISALEENHIPYIYFAHKGLYKKPVVLDIVAYFQLLDNYHESSALYRVANLPVFGVSHAAIVEIAHFAKRKSLSLFEGMKRAAELPGLDKKSQDGVKKLLGLLEKHSQTARQKSTEQLYIEVVNDLDFAEAAIHDYQVGKYLENFRRRIQNFQSQAADKRLKNFMSELVFEMEAGGEGELELDTDTGPEAVKLMTVHGAKGLEFKHVFVVGLVDKRFPSIERRDPIEIPGELIKDILPVGDIHLEEERRLFYVAMTRAKSCLFLTRALDYGGKLTKKPSRFLQELGLVAKEMSRPTGEVVFHKPALAKSVSLPVPKVFSFSQISLFRKCPLEYKYRHVLKLPVPGKAAFSFGQTIHKTLEKYLNVYRQNQVLDLFGKPSELRLPGLPELTKIYDEVWLDDWYESQSQMREYREQGLKILKSFYTETQKNPPHPKYLEKKFRLPLDEYWIEGKLDRADATPDGLLIIDYKTGTARGIYQVDRQQLLLYQWAAQEYLKEKVADLQYWFLWDNLEKESFLGSAEDIEELKEQFSETAREIVQTTKQDAFAEKHVRAKQHDCKYLDLGL